MLLGYMPPTILETVRIRPCLQRDLGVTTAHVVPFCHLPAPLVIRHKHQQMASAFPSWAAGEGLLSHGEVISQRLRNVRWTGAVGQGKCHTQSQLGFKNAPDDTPRAWWEGGKEDGESLWGMRCLWWSPPSSSSPDPLLGATTPLGGKGDAGEKSPSCSISVFIFHPNQMDCGQKCMKMQSNEAELQPLSMSKVETVIKPGFVSVWVDSPAVFYSHQGCTSAFAAAAARAQQWPWAVPKPGLVLLTGSNLCHELCLPNCTGNPAAPWHCIISISSESTTP